MRTIVDIFTTAVHDNLRPLYANWEPGKPVELGDYGLMSGDLIVHVGNIRDLGIDFDVRNDPTTDRKTFATKGSTEVKLNAKGSTTLHGTVNAKASLEINFSSEDAVFFNAADCKFSMIRDKSAVGREIMKHYETDQWDRGWAVVTDMVTAGATTIAVSGGSTASVVFEAKGDVERIDLADASVGLKVTNQKNVGYLVEAEKGLIPLLGLSKIQSSFLWFNEQYKPLSVRYSERALSSMRNSPKIRTEETAADLHFGQLK